MIFLILLAILLVYLAAMLALPIKGKGFLVGRPAWYFAAAIAAAMSAATVLAVLSWAEHTKNGSQIAWIGLEGRRADDALTLGGSRHDATIGWPSGSFSPEVK